MAKKAAEGTINKSEAVRQTLSAGIDNPTDGSKHIKETFGLDVTPQVFSTIKSITNKKKAGGKAPGRKAKAAAAAPAPKAMRAVQTSNPADLARQVKALVDTHGVDAIKEMADVFAG